jgi:cytochrome c-type biogenesis protein CcmE
MAEYEGSLRNRLLVIIFVLPFIAIAVLLYLVNYA